MFHFSQKMGILIDYGELSKQKLDRQITTITWPRRIKKDFDENASIYEQNKSIFEEKLATIKENLMEKILKFIKATSIINDMNNDEKLRDNSKILSKFIEEIEVMEETRNWINKEETLLKQTCSLYPKLDDIRNFVDSFHNLIR